MRLVPVDNELTRQLISEARQLHALLPVLMPLLDKRKASAFQKLLANHRDGKHSEQLNAIAELSVINGIEMEIKSKLDNLNLQEMK